MGAKIIRGSQAARVGVSQPLEPSDWQASDDDHEDRDDGQAQADRDERIAIRARDDERQSRGRAASYRGTVAGSGVDRDADIGAEVGAGAAKLLDHFARRREVAPGRAGREELERNAANDEDLVVL